MKINRTEEEWAAIAACSSGLVSLVTSDTDKEFNNLRMPVGYQPDEIILDPIKMRLDRMKKAVLTGARLHGEDLAAKPGSFRTRCAMLTLTYAQDGEHGAKDITQLIKCIREYLRRKGMDFRYIWVMELTKNGRPHYHIMMWLPKGVTLPKPDKRGWWTHGSTRIEWIKNSKCAVGYLAKYLSKGTDISALPAGARLHGCGGLNLTSRWCKAWWLLPKYIRETWPSFMSRPARAPGGGWIAKASGEWMESRYILVSFNPLTVKLRSCMLNAIA